MTIEWKDITVSLDAVDTDELLNDWRWLVDESIEPVLVTAMGDAFLRDPEGKIFWLDVASGTLGAVADTVEAFEKLIAEPENLQKWFMPELVLSLKESGMFLGEGEVYGLDQPAVLGGEYVPGNISPTNMYVHFGMHGQVHEQVKDLPPGTKIGGIQIED